MENKVNSLIVDYEIVLGLRTYFGKFEKIIGFKCLGKVASSSYTYVLLLLLLPISGLNGFTDYL